MDFTHQPPAANGGHRELGRPPALAAAPTADGRSGELGVRVPQSLCLDCPRSVVTWSAGRRRRLHSGLAAGGVGEGWLWWAIQGAVADLSLQVGFQTIVRAIPPLPRF